MIRVLFATAGWPSGILEVGSWAVAQGLAQVVIRQIQPAKLFTLEQDLVRRLRPGPLPEELRELFHQADHPVPEDAALAESSVGWIVRAGDGQTDFYIVRRESEADVFDAARLAWDVCARAVWEFQERTGQRGRFLRANPLRSGQKNPSSELLSEHLSEELWEALGAVGGGLIERVITYRPHVIGFRLEGGDQDQIAGFIRACRLFSRAEIVLGGPTSTSHPREVLEDLGADYVFAGEAEETFAQFLRLAALPYSRDFVAEIPGLAYAYGGRTFHNTLPSDGYGRTAAEPRSKEFEGHNRVRPIVPSALLEADRLNWNLLEGFDRPLKSLFFTASRGCPGMCTFCAKLHGPVVRWKSAQRLLEEIRQADACVRRGKLSVERWPLFAYTDRPDLQPLQVTWAAVYDEDFFLSRRRALEFFHLWETDELKTRYRLSFQTNPCSLLDRSGRVDAELLAWIDRLKPMIQVGGESFHPELLARWRKRHTVAQLQQVLDALESTHQDYTVFILLSDFDSTPEEVVDTVRLLALEALPRRGMRIASSPFTIPLYDSQTRWDLEYRGRLPLGRVRNYREYERPQPGWMDPYAARLADLADAELHFALQPAHRDAALVRAMEVVVETIRSWGENVPKDVDQAQRPWDRNPFGPQADEAGKEPALGVFPQRRTAPNRPLEKNRWRLLLDQAEWSLAQVRERAFQLPRLNFPRLG